MSQHSTPPAAGGQPAVALIPLTQGKFAAVDSGDPAGLSRWRWYFDASTGYAVRNASVGGKVFKVYMHRLILGFPEGRCDHRDRDRLNNTRANLRACTPAGNAMNQGLRTTNTSGYKGVSRSRCRKYWLAHIRGGGRRVCLGSYRTPEEAAAAYDAAARQLHGEFAWLNFPGRPVPADAPLGRVTPVNNASGFRGVTYCKQTGKWVAQIQSRGGYTKIGRYADREAAARAYDEAARRLHGARARLNFGGGV